jgi:hypothetical protein
MTAGESALFLREELVMPEITVQPVEKLTVELTVSSEDTLK